MLRLLACFVFLLTAVGGAQAATLYLKNGSTVVGTVISRTADSVKMDVSGVTLTYYSDEVDRVDEGSLGQVTADVPAVDAQAAAMPAEVVAPPAQKPAVEIPVVQAPPVMIETAPASTPTPSAAVEPVAAPAVGALAGMSKKELILKFIDVFGTRSSMAANFEQMASTMPADQSGLFKDTFKVSEIIEMLVPLYDKHFTESELKELVAFYSTPVGAKLVRTIPLIMNDSVDVSTKYFESHMGTLTEGLKKSGVGAAQPAK